MTELHRVVLAGGGTAGHVLPLLATADALRRRHPDVNILVLGTHEGLESRLVPERGYPLATIAKVAFPRRPDLAAVRFPLRFRAARRRAREILEQARPDAVVGFGGYVCPPAYLAARDLHVPVVIHEGNTRAGLANRLGARFAAKVATTFSATKLPGAVRIGLPLRTEISRLDRATSREEALAHFGFAGERPVVLVSGGSLGAQRLNEAFVGAAAGLVAAGVDVLHVTGRGKMVAVPPALGGHYVALEYCDRMDLAFAAADLLVARSGAGMVSEAGAVGLPAVFVPLPIGNGEQRLNAADLERAGAAVVVDDAEVTPGWVLDDLAALVLDASRLTAMARAAREHSERDADEKLVSLIETAVEESRGGRG